MEGHSQLGPPLVLSFFLLHQLGIIILFAYFILLELYCISNSFIFFPLSLIHLIFNPLLLHFPSHGGPLRGKTGR